MSTLSTVLITAAALVILPAFPAAAQPPADPALASPAVTTTSDLPPAPAATMAAYRTIEPWVRALQAPDASPEGLPSVVGAAVILRSGGQIVGRGGSISQSPDPAAIWLAARDAIAEARRRLPPTKDLVAEEALRETAAAITISLELAGPLTPILPEPATWPDAELILSPGLDGVAVRLGQGPDAPIRAIFPSQMIPTNTMPHQALAASASQVGGDATMGVLEPRELREKHGAAMFRFRTTHLAQSAAGAEPGFLVRGGRSVSMAQLGATELRAMADGIATHLMNRFDLTRSEDHGEGAYEPWRDAAAAAGNTADDALAAFALEGYRSIVSPSSAQAARCDFVLQQIPKKVAFDGAQHSPIGDRLTAQAFLAAYGADRTLMCQRGPAVSPPDPLAASVFNPQAGFSADVPVPAWGLIALALTRSNDIPRGEAATRRAFRDTPETQLVGQMPWLGWAELRLADLKARQDPAAPRDIPSAIALRRMREQVWQHMLTEADCGPDNPDLVGGIVFTKSKVLLPTWQSARPLAFIATMLGDPRLTEPQEFNTELVRLLTALRFLRQLQADEATMWMFPNRDRALGGIRAAAWDQRMPIDASAMTLLAVCETLKSLEARAKMQEEQPPADQGQSSASPK